jgi:flagellar basal-body rod protein FlgF
LYRGLYTAASGMNLQLHRQDAIANNLANIDTTGYKKDEAIGLSFRERLLYAIDRQGIVPIGYTSPGVEVDEVYTDLRPGSYMVTGNPLDLALSGTGFFLIDGAGSPYLTRSGSFTRDAEGFLVTAEGEYVLGERGPIPLHGEKVDISEDGVVYVDDLPVERILTVRPENPAALEKVGHNRFRLQGGWQPTGEETLVLQGQLERANVNPIQEMVKMIEVTRAYETNHRAILVMDDLMRAANELGRV